ncbi:MAG: molybdopterin-dependent oxidoreductase, partial [bacterium]|nr:molybdopterin-dependent oxidoreductase [bacterium]
MEIDKGKKFSVINTSPPRLETYDKATGKAKYAADLSMPDMLIGAILGSPVAHAKILNVDTSRAERLPGVAAVVTAKDAGNVPWGHSPARYDETTFAVEKVRHVGDEVAAVVAVDEQTAKEALELIKVDYEELPALLDPVEALAGGAPLLHQKYLGNISQEVHNHFGNVEEGFARADYIRTDRFMNNKIDGAMLEPQACLAVCDLQGKLTLWSSTQVSHYVQRTVAIALNLPIDKVRVIAPTVGGGFGIKASTGSHEIIACLLAIKTGRPVKLVLDREQVFW